MKKIILKAINYVLSTDKSADGYIKLGSYLFSIPNVYNRPSLNRKAHQLLFQGFTNSQIIPYLPKRIWPFWVYTQNNPSHPHFSGGQQAFVQLNHTHRNWTHLSYPGCEAHGIIDPFGLVTPTDNGWSLDMWVANSTNLISPSQLTAVSQELEDGHSVVKTGFQLLNVTINATTFLKPIQKGEPQIFHKVTLQNTSSSPVKLSFFFAIRPYNPEGISPISSITYHSSNAFVINNRLGLVLDQKPQNIVCLNAKEGDVSERYNQCEMILGSKCSQNLCSAIAEYRITLDANQTKSITCKLPTLKNNILNAFQDYLPPAKQHLLKKRIGAASSLKFESEKQTAHTLWKGIESTLFSIALADKKIETLFLQNRAHLLTFISPTHLTSGAFSHTQPNLLNHVLGISALHVMGSMELSQKLIVNVLHSKEWRPFIPKESMDKMGQIIYLIHHHFQFTKNQKFLDFAYPFVENEVKMIEKVMFKSKQTNPLRGLIKRGLSPDSTGDSDDYLWHNFWSLYGLRTAKILSEKCFKTKNKQIISDIESLLSTAIRHFASMLSSQFKQSPFLPVSPTRGIDPNLIYNLISIWPLDLYDPHDPVVTQTLSHIESYFLSDGLYFSPLGQCGFSPFLNTILAMVYLKRHDSKAMHILKVLTQSGTQTGSFPDAIHPKSGGGMSGDGHSLLSTASMIHLIRSILIQEDNGKLILTPMIPSEWLNHETVVNVKNAPTIFGPIHFSLIKKAPQIFELTLKTEFHTKPSEIILRLPVPIVCYNLDGQTYKVSNKKEFSLPLGVERIEIECR
ncbi:MAG: hypothetical protein HRT90_04365 [Candidatus Margulisbacteria bacterium]|nr:hypothetical protein [Candidatus Margulisiibacteriota bacterium]